ncbi:hypothetical protein LSAT2_015270, partial [Lamellibrachia satsuma]
MVLLLPSFSIPLSLVKEWIEALSLLEDLGIRQPPEARVICPTALFPLFLDSAQTVAMIRHSLDVVKNAVEHLKPGQTPVVTFDQPRFALAKQIWWKWLES